MEMVKKGFLQACINHGSLTMDTIHQILTPLCEAYDVDMAENDSTFKNFVKEINKEIRKYEQTLTFIKHPLVGEEYLVFGLTFETQACRHQQHYSEEDRHYFAKLMEEMVNREVYGIPWIEVYSVLCSMPDTQKHLTKNRAQELVEIWTQQGYFLEKDDMIYFGPRMIVEYGSHLKIHFPSLAKDCPLCCKIVLWDVKCSECNIRIHRDCIRSYLIKNSNCPSCKKTWNTRLSLSQ